MDSVKLLKAVADETRMNILTLLLRHNHCVRALAGELGLTEATISQHLKVLREAGLLEGHRRGYYMHYKVQRDALRELAGSLEALAATPPHSGEPQGGCHSGAQNCPVEGPCDAVTRELCHGEGCGEVLHSDGKC